MSQTIPSLDSTKHHDSAIWYTSFETPNDDRHPTQTQLLAFEIQQLRSSTRGLTKAIAELEPEAAQWFIEGLYQAFHSLPQSALALPLSERFYGPSRVNSVPYNYGCIQRVVKAAQHLGWIEVIKGHHSPSGGKVSRINAAGELAEAFQAFPLAWAKIKSPKSSELIVMSVGQKDKQRRFVNQAEHPDVQTWQRNLNQINELLASKCIHLDTTNDNIQLAAMGQSKGNKNGFVSPINFSKVSLRRIFSRDQLDCGGRFYGGWWQNIPSVYRPYVAIDGGITVEADYSGMALNSLYAISNEFLGDGDPYDIGLNYLTESDPKRKLVKKYINATLNDENKKFRLSHDELTTLGISSHELHAGVLRRHPKIAKYFNSGIGLHLQFVESQIAESVMIEFLRYGEACLPIHDSFIVRHELIDQLESVMQESFQRRFNTKIKIKSENIVLGERMGAPNPDLIPYELPLSEQADFFRRLHWERVSVSSNYYVEWVIATQTLEEITANYDASIKWWQVNREKIPTFIDGQ